MRARLRALLQRLANRLFARLLEQLDRHDADHESARDGLFAIRAVASRKAGEPIRMLLVCHSPALWSMFDSIYREAVKDPAVAVSVVTLPYRHETLPKGTYKDDRAADFLRRKGIQVIEGYNPATQEWVAPAALEPHYIFFQTPYDLFPPQWSIPQVSAYARVCYIPYATSLFRGEVDDTLHPVTATQHTRHFFLEGEIPKAHFDERFRRHAWYTRKNVVVTGHPKLDYLQDPSASTTKVWRRGGAADVRRILWTPRWRTSEGTCHFFSYRRFFEEFCARHAAVDFAFRPHPLCLQNFLQTGELTAAELESMERTYQESPNMIIDRSGDYQGTFLSSDILVSDISSMLLEFFATGKPIIYTHRVQVFNELGEKLARGFYWARTQAELAKTLEMLLAGEDPLAATRRDLIATLVHQPDGGAGRQIIRALTRDFTATTRSSTVPPL